MNLKFLKIYFQSKRDDPVSLASEWRIVFLTTAAIYLLGAFGYFFIGSAEAQSWATETDTESDNPIEMQKSYQHKTRRDTGYVNPVLERENTTNVKV